ncbi:MAG: prepilin-type N-terminal cleavage/methylation domain-containing protein [Elusimicrobia bacterium]|nr:prepilin-type N-terminal cleavage/methylation domain-containing protein [Elusimicrobiota bacterium]
MNMHIKMHRKGFTLIELMIVVAIIGILAAIAIPKFSDLINKAKEGATKGALSSIRSALQVYYADNEGWFPTDSLSILTAGGKYISSIPAAKVPTRHYDSTTVMLFSSVTAGGLPSVDTVGSFGTVDSGGWAYFNNATNSTMWGTIMVNCTHQDLKPTNYWTAF